MKILLALMMLAANAQIRIGNGAGSSEYILQSAYQSYAAHLTILLRCSDQLNIEEMVFAQKLIQNSSMEKGGLFFNTKYDVLVYTENYVGSPIVINTKILEKQPKLNKAKAFELIFESLAYHLHLSGPAVLSLAQKAALVSNGDIKVTEVEYEKETLASIVNCSQVKLFVIGSNQKVMDLTSSIKQSLECSSLDQVSFLNPVSRVKMPLFNLRLNIKYRCEGQRALSEVMIEMIKVKNDVQLRSVESRRIQ